MTRYGRSVRQAGILLFLVGLAAYPVYSGVADPAKPEGASPGSGARAGSSSWEFQGIWYRTPDKRGRITVWLASGDLKLSPDTISFDSKKIQLSIPTSSVTRLAPADFRDDPVHTWILVEYDEEGTKKAAAFKDGRMVRGDTGAVYEAFRSALSAQAASAITALHTSRVESLYYTNESVPRNVWRLVFAPDLEEALLQAYAAGDPDDLFRYNIIMVLNRRLVNVKDEGMRRRIHDCMLEAVRKDGFGWVKVEALDGLRRLGDKKEALAQAEALMKSEKDAAIHEDVAKLVAGMTTAPAVGSKTAPDPGAAGAASSGRDLILDTCIEAQTARFKAKGQEEKSEVSARLVCGIVATGWDSSGCGEDPGQDACRKTLRDLDASLTESGLSMLYAAAHRGAADICATMIAMGSNPNATVATGWTPLLIAAAEGHAKTVVVLLDAGAEPNRTNDLGRTALMFAAAHGHTAVVKELLVRRADPNVVPADDEGWTALMAAADKGHVESVQLLLGAGADASIKDKRGNTALSLAESKNHSEVARLLGAHDQDKKTSDSPAPAVASGGFMLFEGLKDQFTISLPEGWVVHNQDEALFGRAGPHGMVFFSAQPVTKAGEKHADPELLARVDSGEVPSFFVDRQPAKKGMSCAEFTRSAGYSLGTMVANDPVYGTVRRMFSATPPPTTRIELAGCQGFRIEGHAGRRAPEKSEWVIDVRAISDGRTLYLFSLRNTADNYAKNLKIFEQALSTLKLASNP